MENKTRGRQKGYSNIKTIPLFDTYTLVTDNKNMYIIKEKEVVKESGCGTKIKNITGYHTSFLSLFRCFSKDINIDDKCKNVEDILEKFAIKEEELLKLSEKLALQFKEFDKNNLL